MKIQYSLFDTLLEPVFVLNAEQKVVYCNETAAIIAGLSIRKITRGMKLLEIFEFSEPIEGLTKLISITDATPYKEVTFKTAQGGEGKVQITLQPIFDSMGDKNWIVFVRDVTLEERLQKKYRAELEQKEDVIKALEDAKVQLENYSKNLEQMVADRTRELSRLNQTMSALLDSLGQGFFIFNSEGKILDVSSKACETTVECKPEGKDIWEVLKLPENKVDGFKKWMMTVFMEMLPFEDLAPLGPTTYPHSQNRNIALEYHPLRSSEGAMDGIVVVASDITSLVEAQKQAEREKEHAKLIINMIKSKREIHRFIQESQELLISIREEVSKDAAPDTESLYRSLHTLKGGAALFSVKEVAESCHMAEGILNDLSQEFSQSNFIALRAKCFEIEEGFFKFLDETKEILGTTALSDERQIEVAISKLNDIARKVGTLPGGGQVAQELLLELAMEPVERFFEPYNEVMLRLGEKVDKMVAPLKITHGNVMVIPEIYSSLFSTLVHAFRNAVDHGIELPDLRVDQGKPAEGHIEVAIEIKQSHAGPQLAIKIVDDGGGIDPVKIREKLAKKMVDTRKKSDQDVIQHIFDSQFSTRDQVTEISGRGVGMDAIKYAAEELQGRVWVESTVGIGTCLFIEVPYITEFKKDKKKTATAA
ncbi:ATP-binding protein [Bdellovibrio reynosensis]|uniref:histidine kinase n=1 Tax=Bdellovibrio reynosensis TaxID=2835041 RepID=A0ABY4CCV9_9BACT|nr:ATP-binding protein [Bdellovibrio reynosensis]UOF01697.1 ATP-binding protein [Bdellovibrio reynosensis]